VFRGSDENPRLAASVLAGNLSPFNAPAQTIPSVAGALSFALSTIATLVLGLLPVWFLNLTRTLR